MVGRHARGDDERTLDPDEEQLVWPLERLDEQQVRRLQLILDDAGIPYEMDPDGLAGLARDAGRISPVLDELVAGDTGAVGGDEVDVVEAGLAWKRDIPAGIDRGIGILGRGMAMARGVFGSGLTPARNARDADPRDELASVPDDGTDDGAELDGLFADVAALADDPTDDDAAARLRSFVASRPPVPFGMSTAWWGTVVDDVAEVVATLDRPAPRHAAQQAAHLRDRLRNYV